MRILLMNIIAIAAVASFSIAQSDKYPFAFSDMDANGDGRVTWAEFHDFLPELSKWEFGGADINNDGAITPDEWSAFTSR